VLFCGDHKLIYGFGIAYSICMKIESMKISMEADEIENSARSFTRLVLIFERFDDLIVWE